MILKADLHLHTREREPVITYDARALIDRAAREAFRVLSITNHDTLTFGEDLAAYARERDILLIPGVEATIEGKHVLLYNLDVDPRQIRTFADLRRLRRPEWLVVAAHPFYPSYFCLRERLLAEIDLFDAIEFSHFYTSRIDFNRRAVRVAREVGLPLVGTSDSHLAAQFGTTYSVIDGEPSVAAILSAIRKGRVSVVSRPLTLGQTIRIGTPLTILDVRDRVRRALRALSSGRGTPSRAIQELRAD
ncbi:MAG: PHP-associated domain-containing protein [Candidatus Rokuibacteriota bacterium]